MAARLAGLRSPKLAVLLVGIVLWVMGTGRPENPGAGALPLLDRANLAGLRAYSSGDAQNPVPREPIAIALTSDGDVLVADVGLAQVHRFGRDGRLLRSYGESLLRYPVGIAVSDDGRAWVADLWLQQLLQLDLATGQFSEVGREPTGYQMPAGLFTHHGLLYVIDLGRHQILVLNQAGDLVRVIGEGRGSGPAELSYPTAITAGDDGEILVTDSNNGRIQVFDREGRSTRILRPSRLTLPRGIARDRSGRLYVADTLAHQIVVIDREGHIAGRFGDEDLAFPNGIALRDRTLYIADRGSGRLIAWDLGRD